MPSKIQRILLPEELPEHKRRRLRALSVEYALRKIEALRLYEPLPLQKDFHASLAKERIAWGSNRSAKTLTCAV